MFSAFFNNSAQTLSNYLVKKESIILKTLRCFDPYFQYKGKGTNIAKRFVVSGGDPYDDDDNSDVDVAVNEHRKSCRILLRKSMDLRGIR